MVALCWGTLMAEVVVEFDSEKKAYPEGLEPMDEKALKDGVCIIAGEHDLMGQVHAEGFFGQLFNNSVRYAVRGEKGRSATLKAIPAESMQAETVIMVILEEATATAFVMPADLNEKLKTGVPIAPKNAFMDADLNGLENFMKLIQKNVVATRKAGEVPRMVVVARSTTSFGQVVDMLQLIRLTGCRHGLVLLNDEIPSLNAKVLIDPSVMPPVAKSEDMESTARIVVNIHDDGSFSDVDLNPLKEMEDVKAYVAREKKKHEANGLEPKLHIRGDKESVFKHSRKVIRAAAGLGVNRVIFAVVAKPALAVRESDLKMALPADDNEGDEKRVIEVTIDAKNQIVVNGQVVDVPQLRAELQKAVDAHPKGAASLRIQIGVDPDVVQQRVIDVLNVMAAAKIQSVTFMDGDNGEK